MAEITHYALRLPEKPLIPLHPKLITKSKDFSVDILKGQFLLLNEPLNKYIESVKIKSNSKENFGMVSIVTFIIGMVLLFVWEF